MTITSGLWTYRGFIFSSVVREFQSKYRNSLLGVAWMVLNPLAMILVYTLIFSQIMHSRLPGVDGSFSYSIYLCAGVLAWGLFAELVGRAQMVFIDNANLLKKLSFPRLCLPVIVVLSALLNFSIVMGLFFGFLVLSGHWPGWVLMGLLPVLALHVLFAIGLGVALGVLNVFFRDVGQAFGIVLQFWFWLTPVVYPVSVLPREVAPWMALNPMATLVGAYQQVLLYQRWPDWAALAPVAALALALCAGAAVLFRRHAPDMVDEL